MRKNRNWTCHQDAGVVPERVRSRDPSAQRHEPLADVFAPLRLVQEADELIHFNLRRTRMVT